MPLDYCYTKPVKNVSFFPPLSLRLWVHQCCQLVSENHVDLIMERKLPGKMKNTGKIFRQINYLVISLVWMLFSRNFNQKRVRVNFRNHHNVKLRLCSSLESFVKIIKISWFHEFHFQCAKSNYKNVSWKQLACSVN